MAHNNPYAVSIQPPPYAPGTRFTVSGRNRGDQQKLFESIQQHVQIVEASIKKQIASTHMQSSVSAQTHPTQNQGTLQRVQSHLTREKELRRVSEQNLEKCLSELTEARKEIDSLQRQL